jgi:hypothetical protein
MTYLDFHLSADSEPNDGPLQGERAVRATEREFEVSSHDVESSIDWLRLLCDLQRLDDQRVAHAAPRFMKHLRVGSWPKDTPDMAHCRFRDWPCVETTYALNRYGYAQFQVPELRIYLVHYFGFELFIGGAVPHGYQLHHACENPRCVIHLWPKAAGPHIADHNRARRRPKIIDSYTEERDNGTFTVNVLEPAVRPGERKPRGAVTESRRETKRDASPSRTSRPGKALARNRRRRYLRRGAKKRSEGGDLN